MNKEHKIHEILNRWVSDVNIKKDLEKKLNSWKKLRVKFGIDPTWFDLTLGHAVPLRKLKQFQDLWHHIILLIWNFTAQIWDPTWKDQTRKVLSKEDVMNNAKDYMNQAWKILDMSKVEIVYNADWLERLNFEDVLNLAWTFTVQQMLHRDMFKKRFSEWREINLVEFMYPLMQWYDSIPLEADVEIWWNDQLFNLMAWRVIQEKFWKKAQDIITTPILVWLDWKEKMSKSLWNYIALNDSPREMFWKTMSIPDDVILNYFELATEIPMDDFEKIRKDLSEKNPRDTKISLAKEIVKLYHWEVEAEAAHKEFEEMFKKWWKPDDIEVKKIDFSISNPVDIIFELWLVPSKGEWRRMIQWWAVKVDWEKIESIEQEVSLKSWMTFQVWKRKWAEVA